MRKVIIETEVQYQLAELKDYLIEIQGDKKGKKTFSEIIAALDSMEYFGDVGSNISERFNIDCPSNWFLYIFTRIILSSAKQIPRSQY